MHWDDVTRTKSIEYVSMLSTVHTFDLVNTNETNRETGAIIHKPDAILDYNKTMGGVDLVSRSRVQVNIPRAQRKCDRCTKNGIRHDTRFRCCSCEVVYVRKNVMRCIILKNILQNQFLILRKLIQIVINGLIDIVLVFILCFAYGTSLGHYYKNSFCIFFFDFFSNKKELD